MSGGKVALTLKLHAIGFRLSPRPRIDTLTSLRFFAAPSIVLFHLPGLMPSVYSGRAFELMNIGVDFFFILSGYVLGVTYAKSPEWNVKDYFRRRFARIYPVYLMTTLVWTYLWLDDWAIPTQDKFNSGLAHLLLLQAFFSGPSLAFGFNAVAWTISCEAFFYALFPLVRHRGALIMGVVTLGIFFILYRTSYDALLRIFPAFFGLFPPVIFWKFCFGLALAQLWVPRLMSLSVGTLMEAIAIALVLVVLFYQFPIEIDLLAVAIAIIALFTIAVFSCQSGLLSRVLMLPIFVLLGDASYALYLWHHMLMLWVGKRLPTSFSNDFERAAVAAGVVGAIILLSVATYKLYEVPLRTLIAGRKGK